MNIVRSWPAAVVAVVAVAVVAIASLGPAEAQTKITVGKNFEMKASSNMTIKASGTGDIESSDAMTLKGSKVNIN